MTKIHSIIYLKLIFELTLNMLLNLLYPFQIAGQSVLNYYSMRQINKYQTLALSRNFVSSIHATGAVILSGLALTNGFEPETVYAAQIWSCGYFLYDSICMLRYDKHGLMRSAYLYHHLASIYVLQFDPAKYYGLHAIFWGELSNLPSYLVYHNLKTNPRNSQLVLYKNIQKYMYGFIRLPIVGYYLWKAYFGNKVGERMPVLAVVPVYLMGIIWSYKLLMGKK